VISSSTKPFDWVCSAYAVADRFKTGFDCLVIVAGEFRCGGNPFTISRLVRTSMAAFRCTVIIQQILQKVSSGHPSCLPPVSVSFLSARPRHFPYQHDGSLPGVRKMHNAARLAGLLHDLGKYTPAFQAKLRGALEKVDHSTAGAVESFSLVGALADRGQPNAPAGRRRRPVHSESTQDFAFREQSRNEASPPPSKNRL